MSKGMRVAAQLRIRRDNFDRHIAECEICRPVPLDNLSDDFKVELCRAGETMLVHYISAAHEMRKEPS